MIEFFLFFIFKSLQERLGSWFSNTGTTGTTAVGNGVGKYLKARTTQADTASNTSTEANGSSKKRKAGDSKVEYKDFSAW